MEALSLQRKCCRTSFTKTYNILLEKLENEENEKQVSILMNNLERLSVELNKFDDQILPLVLAQGDEDKYEAEYTKVETYRVHLETARVEVTDFLRNKAKKESDEMSSCTKCSSPGSSRKKLHLPKIEIKRFGGEIKDWLSFWSQFKRIHEDNEIEAEDKFQYLIQAMIVGSKARDVIESFPATAKNYEKAIDVLKKRFGREELLIEHYVRELISLVIRNTNSGKGKINVYQLYDKLESHLRALESIGMTRDKYAAMLFPLVESCIPEEVLRAWIRSPLHTVAYVETDESKNIYSNRLQQLLTFLRCEVEGEERITMAKSGFKVTENQSYGNKEQKYKKTPEESVPTASNLYSGDNSQTKMKSNTTCLFCEKYHESKECFHAQRMSTNQKKDIVTKKKGCFVCLKVGHLAKNCKSSIRCIVCSRKHTTIMCPTLDSKETTKLSENRSEQPKPASKESTSLTSQNMAGPVLLQTLVVQLNTNETQSTTVRALIDSGSQRSYLLKETAERMNLKAEGNEELVHTLFGGVKSKINRHNRYKICVSNIQNKNSYFMTVLDQPTICGPVPRLNQEKCYDELKCRGIVLTDFGMDDRKIELLIGADFLGDILTGQTIKLDCGLVATETILGWTVMGRVNPGNTNESNGALITSLFIQTENLPDLWELDVLGITDPYEKQSKKEMDQAIIQHFKDTVTINNEGRYEVMLPWVDNKSELEDNKIIAEKRLQATTNKLLRETKLKEYDDVFKLWEESGIIKEVDDKKMSAGYYLPHHAVIKEQSTTKVRPVFDASSKAKNCISLNDCLEKGPNLLEEIPPILIKFREKKIGVTSDIEKAFLQISLNESDCEYLKFLWWENYEKKTVKVFQHRRLPFGLNCSPFILGSTINYLLVNCSPEYKNTAEILKKSFYVDNCVTSLDTTEDVNTFIESASSLMFTGKFNLRDWKYTLQENCIEEENQPIKVLGLLWDNREDKLYCDVTEVNLPARITRRFILSCVQRVFDPIGFTCPATLYPKILLQESWKTKLSWDDGVPIEIENKFLKWYRELSLLNQVRIPRYTTKSLDFESMSLHVFCDASKSAYSSVVFLRSGTNANTVEVSLMMAKTRIAPLKPITIPRLELMACCLGVRLAKTIRDAMERKTIPTHYWTDSSTVLYWITENMAWGTFVHNRVKEIRQLTNKDTWRHVPGLHNPADLPSRGCTVKFLQNSLWWEGPGWLKLEEEGWPKSERAFNKEEVLSEQKKCQNSTISNINQNQEEQWYLKYFSKYSKIIRMTAWILRFSNNCRLPTENRVNGELSVEEINQAEIQMMKQVQKEGFSDQGKDKLKTLCTYQDSEGIIRTKTKISTRKNESEGFKYPIILPSQHPLVRNMIYEEHTNMSHAGINTLLYKMREKFWILKGRRTIRGVISKCATCKRHSGRQLQTIPVALPEDRVKDAAVFQISGVDLAGPLILKGGEKAWIIVFTCAIYRAVHLELVMSLSTNGFLLGLRRFIARRGRPQIMYSDNGTNFAGTDNLFRSIDWKCIERQSSISRIQWKFIPPTAAWWGGWWERIVQMVKYLLKRVLGRTSLNYEEMSSTLCDCESVINSRPLTYLSEDPEEILPLTPAMFLQENSQTDVIDLDTVDKNNFTKRFRYQQLLREELRRRFRTEYLSQLLLKTRRTNQAELKVGDIVLVGSDNKKRIDWPLARIENVYPGKDGVARVFKLKTASGFIIRPLQRLYPLEVRNNQEFPFERREESRPKSEDSTVEVGAEKSKVSSRGRKIARPIRLKDFELE